MKSDHFHLSLRRRACDDTEPPILVAGEAYREFTRWLDRELDTLVARWDHAAAPSARRRPRFRFRAARS
jgi:hypothetical protein